MAETYWTIEEWIPPEMAIGKRGYWWELRDARFDEPGKAREALQRVREQGRSVRIVKVTREVEGGDA